ncbi:MAG: CopG family ribbon-helix-helix protein [Candidatus Binataceae bacterium]
MDKVLKIPLGAKIKMRLEKMARDTSRSTSYLATQAIRCYLNQNEWQIAEIKKRIEEADRGEFASVADVKALFTRIRGGQ